MCVCVCVCVCVASCASPGTFVGFYGLDVMGPLQSVSCYLTEYNPFVNTLIWVFGA